ncbi:hypothetical protein FEF26_14655 [Nesterenkonia salmonea]|uniref:Peptide deformylase n=1 Tax=Nesterenkonia salmonea TaxID=1804987 RepID=A0A5R9B722_9MICC|nr:peptide deformylase [Nesterenkonia salmonea]TLP92606.1 hypothetical protein FEF26_14655 [Nesterenkonia salmonea]
MTGWFAHTCTHEYDHLDGYLFVNRLKECDARRWMKVVKREGWNTPGNSSLRGVAPGALGGRRRSSLIGP